MDAEIICVGSEILIGDILNTNSKYISEKLTNFGINIFWHTSVGDNKTRLKQTLEIALKRSKLIFITGGLGPTQDDITKEVLAETIKLELIQNETIKQELIEKFNKKKIKMPLNNLKQAKMFTNAILFKNYNGTAPGFAITLNKSNIIICLPGPPNELKPMFENEVVPFLKKLKNDIIKSKNIYIYGLTESEIDEKIEKLLQLKNPTVGIYAKLGQIRLRISCKAESETKCDELIKPILDEIKLKFKHHIFGIDIDSMENALVQTAIKNDKTIAVAESCTGGLIASKIVSIKNASKCFNFATVCYNNEMKQKILKIDSKILSKFGAVNAKVAQQMASNVRIISNADIGISTTGIAGPGGEESSLKPIGLVFVGLSVKNKTLAFKLNLSNKQRNEIINLTAIFAMNSARQIIKNLN